MCYKRYKYLRFIPHLNTRSKGMISRRVHKIIELHVKRRVLYSHITLYYVTLLGFYICKVSSSVSSHKLLYINWRPMLISLRIKDSRKCNLSFQLLHQRPKRTDRRTEKFFFRHRSKTNFSYLSVWCMNNISK